MRRTIALSGGRLRLLLYAVQLIGLLLVLFAVAIPFDSFVSVLPAVVFASLAVAAAVGLWRSTTGDDGGTRLGTADDITYDPFADPGQAARDRWAKAISRLPGGDDERD